MYTMCIEINEWFLIVEFRISTAFEMYEYQLLF